ncbi:MAG TPA: transcription termination/antitermination NusG family protein, partial [Bryobacteraceae bacterium]
MTDSAASVSVRSSNAPDPWYALQVRTGGEPTSKLLLERKGYPVFLPASLIARRYSDRIKKIEAPLFPGYLFCRLDAAFRLQILQTPGVQSIVGVGGNPAAIDEAEIEAIRVAVSSGSKTQPWDYLKSGDQVRIDFGSMSGLTGLLVRSQGTDRLILSVTLLQRSIAVEINRDW